MLLGTSAGLAESVLPSWEARQKAAISLDRHTGSDCPWTSHCQAWISERLILRRDLSALLKVSTKIASVVIGNLWYSFNSKYKALNLPAARLSGRAVPLATYIASYLPSCVH